MSEDNVHSATPNPPPPPGSSMMDKSRTTVFKEDNPKEGEKLNDLLDEINLSTAAKDDRKKVKNFILKDMEKLSAIIGAPMKMRKQMVADLINKTE